MSANSHTGALACLHAQVVSSPIHSPGPGLRLRTLLSPASLDLVSLNQLKSLRISVTPVLAPLVLLSYPLQSSPAPDLPSCKTQVLLYSIENYVHYPTINHNGREYKKSMYICIIESLCYTADINTTL